MSIIAAYQPPVSLARSLDQPAPPTPEEKLSDSFCLASDLIENLDQRGRYQEPALGRRLLADSNLLKWSFFTDFVAAAPTPTSVEQAKTITLGALQAGLMSGALDGAVLMALEGNQEGEVSEVPVPSIPDFSDILEELRRVFAQAKEILKWFGVGALETVSRESKSAAESLLAGAEEFGDGQIPGAVFSAYLVSAFAAAYIVGGIDSTLLLEAGRRPPGTGGPEEPPAEA